MYTMTIIEGNKTANSIFENKIKISTATRN